MAAVLAARGVGPSQVRSARTGLDNARRFSPIAYLAVALTTIVLLGPSVQPWYFCWSLPFVAVLHLRRGLLMFLLGSSVGLVAMIAPGGRGFQMSPVVLLIAAGSAVVGWVAGRGLIVADAEVVSAAGDDDADRARSGVRTDRRPDL